MEKAEFDALMDSWLHETRHHSNSRIIMRHEACRKIAAAGKSVVKWCLERLEKDRTLELCFLLHEITGENPMPNPGQVAGFFAYKVEDTVKAWLEWGRKQS